MPWTRQQQILSEPSRGPQNARYSRSSLSLSLSVREKEDPKRQKEQLPRRACDIGIAEGGARTHDLEVDLFAVVRATRSTN